MMIAPTWYWLDFVILGIVCLSVITGLCRGFLKELMALCTWALAIWFAIKFSHTVEPWFQAYIHDTTVRLVIAFVGILIATLIVGGLFNSLVSYLLKRSGLNGTDRLLGMGFGVVRGIFIVALLILVVQMTSLPHQEYTQKSRLYAKFTPLVTWLKSLMPELIQHVNVFEHNEKAVDIATSDLIIDT